MNNEWKLVPVVPTWDMLSASGCTDHHQGQHCLHHENRKRIWAAMLGAAPFATQSDTDRECDRLRAQLADLVTLGFNMVGSSGAKRKYHTELLTARLHELQAALAPAAGAAVGATQ